MKVNNTDLHNLALSIGPTNNIYASPMMKKIQQKKILKKFQEMNQRFYQSGNLISYDYYDIAELK